METQALGWGTTWAHTPLPQNNYESGTNDWLASTTHERQQGAALGIKSEGATPTTSEDAMQMRVLAKRSGAEQDLVQAFESYQIRNIKKRSHNTHELSILLRTNTRASQSVIGYPPIF